MEHRVFGRIERNEEMERWTGQVRLDVFSDYDTSAATAYAERVKVASDRATPDGRFRDGAIPLDLIGPGLATPSAGQERTFLDFLKDRDAVCLRVVDAIFDHYQGHWGDWRSSAEPGREDDDSDDRLIPELSDRDGLKSLIRLDMLSVLDVPGKASGILGFCFDCTWDPEHGLGVLVRRGQVIEIGENDLTWRDPKSAGGGVPPRAATPKQIAMQRGIAAAKKLGGRVRCETTEDDGTSVEIDLLGNERIRDSDLGSLGHFPGLHGLKLGSDRVTDAGLEVIREFKDLQFLQLSGAAITDGGLKGLPGFTDLKVLYLDGTNVTDVGLAELRKLPALAGLHLNATGVTDAGLKQVGALSGLKHLDLSDTAVTDAGLRELHALRSLITLDLQGTRVTDAGLTVLREFSSLRYLNLSHCQVTDQGLESLKALKTLRSLKLASTATTDAGIAGLRQVLTGLQVAR